MKLIKVNTERGLELKGAMFGDKTMDSVVIIMSGICSNVFQNDLLPATGELLSQNNIACIIGHAMDAFSCIAYSDHSTGKQKTQALYLMISALFMKMLKPMSNMHGNLDLKR